MRRQSSHAIVSTHEAAALEREDGVPPGGCERRALADRRDGARVAVLRPVTRQEDGHRVAVWIGAVIVKAPEEEVVVHARRQRRAREVAHARVVGGEHVGGRLARRGSERRTRGVG